MKVKRICKTCGKEFFVYSSAIKQGSGKHCSRKCYGESKRGYRPGWIDTKIKCICKQCGKEFYVWPSKIKRGGGQFCSIECSANFHRGKPNIKARVEKIKRICQSCGEEFFVYPSDLKFGKGKYCSIKCSGKSHSGKNNAKWKGGKIKCVCQTCGEEFYRFPSDMKNGTGKFCSRSCSCKSKTKENGNNWKGGTSFVPYCPKFNERRKEAVREFFGRKCLACGADEAEFKTRLPVHHVDHDKEQGCNGKPFNLVPFCSSCHSKEIYNEEEYTKYINKTLEEGFKWGIWNEEEYIRQVMYPDD